MKLKLKRVAPMQAGKILAALYGLMSLIMVPLMLIFMAVGGLAAAQQGGAATLPVMLGMGAGFMILVPVLYAGMGFVFGVLTAAIYNQLARWIGGFELEFEPAAPPVGAGLS